MTASTGQEYAGASRARLNAPTLEPIVGGLVAGFSGGWRPQANDSAPWIQVRLWVIFISIYNCCV